MLYNDIIFSNAQIIMLKKCTFNSQYIAHYAQVEPTIVTDMRHEEAHVTLSSSAAISVLHLLRFESGYQLIDQLFINP